MDEVAVSPVDSVSGDVEDLADTALFQEPEGYYEPEKQPSFTSYTLPSVGSLRLRLVGHSPLWVRDFSGIQDLQLIGYSGPSSMERGTGGVRIFAATC